MPKTCDYCNKIAASSCNKIAASYCNKIAASYCNKIAASSKFEGDNLCMVLHTDLRHYITLTESARDTHKSH